MTPFFFSLIAGIVLLPVLTCAQGADIKKANVAGAFYPAEPQELSRKIEDFLHGAGEALNAPGAELAVVPHAGYGYSGAVAARVYKTLSRKPYATIVILAPSHHYPFSGAAIWPKGGFQTPLGVVPVDEEFAERLVKTLPSVIERRDTFEKEHSLEVQLPFIQKTWSAAKIVPLLLGQPDAKVCAELAAALDSVIGRRDDVLVLVSTDLSHYHPYDSAQAMDEKTLDAVRQGDIEGFWNGIIQGRMEMCGFMPMATGMIFAQRRGLAAEVLLSVNSGDTAGDKSKVVGYSAVVFHKTFFLTAQQKRFLLSYARRTIEVFMRTGQRIPLATADPRFEQTQGVFVTIKSHGQLRGCIGHVIGQEPLREGVRNMAIAAASEDPRFPPVTEADLKDIEIEISVLSPLKRVQDITEIVLGRDGVVVSDGRGHQGIFLPQVALETGWSKEKFLSELCAQKAGLEPDAWKKPDIQLYTFTADVFKE